MMRWCKVSVATRTTVFRPMLRAAASKSRLKSPGRANRVSFGPKETEASGLPFREYCNDTPTEGETRPRILIHLWGWPSFPKSCTSPYQTSIAIGAHSTDGRVKTQLQAASVKTNPMQLRSDACFMVLVPVAGSGHFQLCSSLGSHNQGRA